MKRTFFTLICIFYSGIAVIAQQPKDSAAHFKKMTDDYRKMGLPADNVEMMVQMERELLYPEIKRKADEKRNEEGSKRAKQFSTESDDEEDDAEAQKMMDDAIRKMGKNPAEVNKKMAEIPKSNLKEIPKPGTKSVTVTPVSEAALLAYLNTMLQKAASALSPAKKAKAAQYFGKGRETGYSAVVFWINKEHDLALYLMLKACIEVPQDKLLLNNFATCLSMSGLPEKAIPMLDYILNKLPENATVLNNLGQAWLSTGNIAKAKPILEKAVLKEPSHPEANRSLGKIAIKEGNTAKAAVYLEKALTGGFDSETYNQWSKLAPGKDVSTFIRANHKQYYKEVPIIKRWSIPAMPSTVTEAQEKEQVIDQFFANLEATLNDMGDKIEELNNAKLEKQGQDFLKMQQQSENMKSLDDVTKYNNQFGKLFHPLKAQAQLMIISINSNDYSTSYNKRIEQAEENRKERLATLNKSLQPTYDKIAKLSKEIDGLEGGENGDDELKIQAIEKQICPLRSEVQVLKLTQLAEINTQYMKMVEGILNQRLQEEMYWTALYAIPYDPSGDLYSLYQNYLSDLSRFKNLYPLPAPLKVYCNTTEDKHKAASVKGKLLLWEDSHCPIDINWDVIIASTKMNCREVNISAKFGGITVGWDRKMDPVTWETLEHSISIAGGVKDFKKAFTENIKGKIAIDGKVTIKLDADLVPTDLVVKTQAGAELNGPMGGKAGVDLGSVEISIQGGMRGEGPVPDLVSKMFGN